MEYASVWDTLTAKYQTFVAGVSWAVDLARAAALEGSGSCSAYASSAGIPACLPNSCTVSTSTAHSLNHTTRNPSTTLFHASFNTSLNINSVQKFSHEQPWNLHCCNSNLRRPIQQTRQVTGGPLKLFKTSSILTIFSRVFPKLVCKMLQPATFWCGNLILRNRRAKSRCKILHI